MATPQPDLVDQWLEHLATDRNMSKNTVATYARSLRTVPNAATATREDIEDWWSSRAYLAPTSRNNELSAIRQFYSWCRRWELRTDDPCARIDPVKKPHRESRFVGRADLTKLLEQLPGDLRRAVALGAYAGVRVSEAAFLDWNDIDVDSRRIIVRGKGDKERRVGLSSVLLDHLLPDTGGNVVRAGQKPFSGHTLQMKVNAAFRAQGVDATFHKLRHGYGFRAAAAGVAPTSIARAMGHASLQSTMGYIAATDTDLDVIAEAVTR